MSGARRQPSRTDGSAFFAAACAAALSSTPDKAVRAISKIGRQAWDIVNGMGISSAYEFRTGECRRRTFARKARPVQLALAEIYGVTARPIAATGYDRPTSIPPPTDAPGGRGSV